MKSTLLFLSLLFFSLSCYANDKIVTFSYWTEASPPFVFSSHRNANNMQAGIVKDLGELIAAHLNATPRFINLPVSRIESQLKSGAIDIDCITNPIWKEKPNDYYWSPALFKGADRFLVRTPKEYGLSKFEDLKGKFLGVYSGYTYHPTIMKMIEMGDIKAVKVNGIDHGIQLLLLDRIDALIDFDILLNYQIKTKYSDSLVMADLVSETYELFCAYSKKSAFDMGHLNAILQKMISKGEISSLLKRY